jgi:hypothetical protein
MAETALGLIRVVSNGELVRREREEQKSIMEAEEAQRNLVYEGLAKHIKMAWEDARSAKQHVLPRLRRAHRARTAMYDPEKLASIEQFGGSTEYARLTANKISIVRSWLRDVFLGQTSKPWGIRPTPKASFREDVETMIREAVSAQVAQAFAQGQPMPQPAQMRAAESALRSRLEQAMQEQARETTMRMERKIEDQLAEARFNDEFSDFLDNIATYPTAIMKGPVLRRRKQLSWTEDEATRQVRPEVEDVIATDFENVDPFRIFPAPGTTNPQQGYIFEHHTFTRADLYELIGVPGYDDEAIRAVLQSVENGGLHDWLGFMSDRDAMESVPEQLQKNVFEFDVLEYHGPVRGRDLLDWGLDDPEVNDTEAMYEVCVWMIGPWIIKAQLNYDPLGLRPYFTASYEEIPGEFWGFGLPDILDDMQGVVNAAVRSLVNNMGMASGPQVAVNIDRLPPDVDIANLTPWHIWQVNDSQFGNNAGRAIEFFQPKSNVNELIAVIEKFYQFADDFSLVPRYMAGSDKVGGAGRTASGLSMLMDAANKGLKAVVANIDTGILSPMLTKLYNYNMLYDEDESIKGDAQVVAEGAVSLMRIESLQLRRNEFLQVTGQNPLDAQITGIEGRAEVLRAVADGLELNTDKIVPPEEELRRRMQPAAPPGQGQPQDPAMTGEQLMDGSAVTDNFSPNGMTP